MGMHTILITRELDLVKKHLERAAQSPSILVPGTVTPAEAAANVAAFAQYALKLIEASENLGLTVEEPEDDCIRAKWTMDGAATLEDAATLLILEAARLRKWEEQGWQLTEPIADDYGFIEKS